MFKNISKEVYLITMKINLQKGFTLIELLVVVAIIGILSSIVLVSLNSARQKGRDASVKGSMSSIRAQAEIVYDTDGVYTNLPINTGFGSLQSAINAQVPTPLIYAVGGQQYAVSVTLNSGEVFCVDSNGFSGTASNMITTTTYVCPNS